MLSKQPPELLGFLELSIPTGLAAGFQPASNFNMKRERNISILVALVMAGALSGAQASSETYTNVRFGYRIRYQPSLFRAMPEADNGDGRKFRATKGHASATVWGEWVSNDPLTTAKSEAESSLSACTNGKATYRVNKPALQAVSCTLPNGDVLYRKFVQYKGTVVQLEVKYPQSEKTIWDPVTAAMAQSLLVVGPAY